MQIDIVRLEYQIEVLDDQIQELEHEFPTSYDEMSEYTSLIEERSQLANALSLLLDDES